jgi:hypothetical protein
MSTNCDSDASPWPLDKDPLELFIDMPRILPKSFFGQLLLGTLLVQSLFLFLFIWYTVFTQTRATEGRARERIVQQLDRLSEACSIGLAKNDLKSLQDRLWTDPQN